MTAPQQSHVHDEGLSYRGCGCRRRGMYGGGEQINTLTSFSSNQKPKRGEARVMEVEVCIDLPPGHKESQFSLPPPKQGPGNIF